MHTPLYKYEMHIHTSPCSGGGSDIRAHIDALIQKGYSGMVVTNHFYNGDTRIDRALPWEDFVDAYRQDYLYGLEYAREKDFDLLFGLEEHVGNGQEILLYGITPELIAAHPELKTPDPVAYAEVVHAAGGLVYQAHPYRCAPWILCAEPLACLDQLDGIEVHNAGNHPQHTPGVEGAPAAYFATLPVREMVAAIQGAGLPSSLSYSAGVFVCNDLLYTLLHHYNGTSTRVGFIHIPCLPEQAKEGCPSLPLDDTVRGLTVAIEAISAAE